MLIWTRGSPPSPPPEDIRSLCRGQALKRVTPGVCPEASTTFPSTVLTYPRLGPTGCAELCQPTTKPTKKINFFILWPSTLGGCLMLG